MGLALLLGLYKYTRKYTNIILLFMRRKDATAFTLVELIVVITILAILGTIAFLSFTGYAQSARNSWRLSDMKVIEKAMSLIRSTGESYPTPDNAIDITYSGATMWTQWTFGKDSISAIRRMSNIPTDPSLWIEYTYSVLRGGRSFQIWGVQEWWFLSSTNTIIPETHAISSLNYYGYTIGDYVSYDVPAIGDTWCSLITTPSITLSDIPAWGELIDGDTYNYVYKKSGHLPNSFSGALTPGTAPTWFQILEVLDSCTLSTVTQLDLYVAKLSTAYQQLSSLPKYEEVVFDANSLSFKLDSIAWLEDHGIEVSKEIIDEYNSPLPERSFIDLFTAANSTQLVWTHTPSSASGAWWLASGWDISAHSISGNTMEKNGSSTTLVYPIPSPSITLPNYELSFDIDEFSGWSISSYLRYVDNNNYYKAEISSSGYIVSRNLLGTESIFANISDPVSDGSTILFSVSGDTLVLEVNGVEKENILAGWIIPVGNPMLHLQNNTARIDNFTLTYK